MTAVSCSFSDPIIIIITTEIDESTFVVGNLNILLVLDFFGTIAHKKQELYEKSIRIIMALTKLKENEI